MMPQIKEEVSKKLKKELGIDIENSELSSFQYCLTEAMYSRAKSKIRNLAYNFVVILLHYSYIYILISIL